MEVKLNKETFFNQPEDDFNRTKISSVNDPDNIVNISNKVHSPEISTGYIKQPIPEDVDKNLINNVDNETKVSKNPIESVKDILQEIPKKISQEIPKKISQETPSESRLLKEQSPKKPEEMTGGGKCNPTDNTAGALSFNANSLPKTAGALAYNEEELLKQMSALKKGDKIGSGALATAAITSLISVAPQIIKAIGELRKGKQVGEGNIIYMKDLTPDKYNQMEGLMKQIKNQKNNFKFNEDTNEYVVGSGRFGKFMSNAWHKLKEIYGSESFKPIRNALLNAASNTASKAINKAADKISSKVQNEDLKNVINVAKETAETAKNNIIDTQRGSGCVKPIGSGKRGSEMFDRLANDELQSDEVAEKDLTDIQNIFKKKALNVYPGFPNSKNIVGKYQKVRARSVFM